jgi:ribosomal protein S18 acetylase RimI-like enzyme
MADPDFVSPAPEQEATLADLLTRVLPGASPAGAAAFLRTIRDDPEMELYAAFEGDAPVALYVLRKVGVTTELVMVGVRPDADPARGLEAAAVRDAGDRVGRRPLTVETTEAALAWYKAQGFRLVGRRKRPDGSWSYRLGWHAPRAAGAAIPVRGS